MNNRIYLRTEVDVPIEVTSKALVQYLVDASNINDVHCEVRRDQNDPSKNAYYFHVQPLTDETEMSSQTMPVPQTAAPKYCAQCGEFLTGVHYRFTRPGRADRILCGLCADQKPSSDDLELRPVLEWFAGKMEAKLRDNDWKGGWHQDDVSRLLPLLKGEMQELEVSLSTRNPAPAEEVAREAVDVANFAMMIADVVMGYTDQMERSTKYDVE